MPTETAIIVAGIVLAFAVFVVSLAWADFYTRNVRTPGGNLFSQAKIVFWPPKLVASFGTALF